MVTLIIELLVLGWFATAMVAVSLFFALRAQREINRCLQYDIKQMPEETLDAILEANADIVTRTVLRDLERARLSAFRRRVEGN